MQADCFILLLRNKKLAHKYGGQCFFSVTVFAIKTTLSSCRAVTTSLLQPAIACISMYLQSLCRQCWLSAEQHWKLWTLLLPWLCSQALRQSGHMFRVRSTCTMQSEYYYLLCHMQQQQWHTWVTLSLWPSLFENMKSRFWLNSIRVQCKLVFQFATAVDKF